MIDELVEVFGVEKSSAEKEVVNYYLTGCMSKTTLLQIQKWFEEADSP